MTTAKTTSKQKHSEANATNGGEKIAIPNAEKKLHERMVAFRQKLSKDPQAARHFLASVGITTPKGRLRKIFGG